VRCWTSRGSVKTEKSTWFEQKEGKAAHDQIAVAYIYGKVRGRREECGSGERETRCYDEGSQDSGEALNNYKTPAGAAQPVSKDFGRTREKKRINASGKNQTRAEEAKPGAPRKGRQKQMARQQVTESKGKTKNKTRTRRRLLQSAENDEKAKGKKGGRAKS